MGMYTTYQVRLISHYYILSIASDTCLSHYYIGSDTCPSPCHSTNLDWEYAGDNLLGWFISWKQFDVQFRVQLGAYRFDRDRKC